MEKEVFLSGYCRTTDASRMVEVILEDGEILRARSARLDNVITVWVALGNYPFKYKFSHRTPAYVSMTNEQYLHSTSQNSAL